MLTQGQVGPVTSTQSMTAGAQVPFRQGNMGDLIYSELHGRYYEATYRKSVFTVANQAGVSVTAGLAQTYTGLVVGNPTNSTVNLVMIGFGWASILIPAVVATNVGLMTGVGASVVTSGVVQRCRYVGAGLGQATVSNSCSLPAVPILDTVVGLVGGVDATANWPAGGPNYLDMAGGMVLPPGAFVAAYCNVATTASQMMFSFMWAEVPI